MLEVITVFILSYLWHGMGITVGYHRLLAHRSFKCVKPFEYFWIAGGYLAYQGSPIWWATIHRAHHRYSDTDLDPHSPRKGVKHALFGWMLEDKYPPHINPYLQSKDLISNPIYRFLDMRGNLAHASLFNLVVNILFRTALWVLFGWQVAVANLVASVLVFQVPQMLNVICHIPGLGYKNFATSDDSVNVWWVGLLGLGEGFHNNHHAFPGSAQTGIRRYELDISWLTIKLGKALGLVTWLNCPAPAMRARLARRHGALVRLERLRQHRRKAA